MTETTIGPARSALFKVYAQSMGIEQKRRPLQRHEYKRAAAILATALREDWGMKAEHQNPQAFPEGEVAPRVALVETLSPTRIGVWFVRGTANVVSLQRYLDEFIESAADTWYEGDIVLVPSVAAEEGSNEDETFELQAESVVVSARSNPKAILKAKKAAAAAAALEAKGIARRQTRSGTAVASFSTKEFKETKQEAKRAIVKPAAKAKTKTKSKTKTPTHVLNPNPGRRIAVGGRVFCSLTARQQAAALGLPTPTVS